MLAFDHVAQQVPHIGEAVDWYLQVVPGTSVLYQDESWAFIDCAGARVAFVLADQHPDHLAWRVETEAELEAEAERYGREIATHRDGTRSFYLEAPGGRWVEIIWWPDRLE